MKTFAVLLDEVKDELGTDLTSLYSDIDTLIERWLNRGQDLLDYQIRRTDDLDWSATDTEIPLPADFARGFKYLPDSGYCDLPPGHEVDGVYITTSSLGASAASQGRIVYWAYPRTIASGADSELPKIGDNGIVAYALYSFFHRLSTSRSDYERYSTLLGQNGVDQAELEALGQQHFGDFANAKEELPRKPSVAAY